jgi:hypothetical protein
MDLGDRHGETMLQEEGVKAARLRRPQCPIGEEAASR